MSTARDLDILVIGATGFTGSLIGEYLTSQAGGPTVGLAGRSKQKLERLRAALVDAHGGRWPFTEPVFVESRNDDPVALEAAILRARVVICASGPFLVHSCQVVAACVRLGVDYVDITGETPFVRQCVDLHHAEAQVSGSFVVNMCGFDSVPSDLGTLLTVQRIKAELGEETRRVSCFATMSGALSGGTLESGMSMERDPLRLAQLKDPFLLGGAPTGGVRAEDLDIREALPVGAVWGAPFMMAELNTRVVRRSSELHEAVGEGYGKSFGYSERMLVKDAATAGR